MTEEKQETPDSYTGKLYKKGNINKSWKARYFRVNRFKQTMKYYKEESDSNTDGLEQGTINLGDILRIEVLTNYDITLIKQLPQHIVPNDKTKVDKPFTFQLVSSGRTYVLATENKSQLFKWLRFLKTSLYGEIVKQGWLRKQGSTNKAFKKRYFVLNKYQQLKYYEDEKRDHYLGMIDCTKIYHINHGKIFGSDLRYTLDLNTENRKWVIVAKDKDERVQ